MDALINVGLSSATRYVSPGEVQEALAHYGVEVERSRVAYGEPEDTFVAYVHHWNVEKAHGVAVRLDQDCVAQYDLHTCKGALIGPRSEEWGAFQPEYFKLL